MEKTVSAANANRRFSELLKGVRKGRSYVVTSHGEPVAKIVPAEKEMEATSAARAALLRRLRSQPVFSSNGKRWTRDELYLEQP